MSQSQRARKSLVPGLFRPAMGPPAPSPEERKHAQEAPTLPPPPSDPIIPREDEREVDLVSHERARVRSDRASGPRLPTSQPARASRAPAGIVVDEVVANRRRDSRFDDD